jgi:RHS repeat-associated protein
MNFPEQTKAMKKIKRKALVFEDGGTPASFRAFGWDGFGSGKIISLDVLVPFCIKVKRTRTHQGGAFKKKERWTSSDNSLGGAANTMYGQAPGPKGKAPTNGNTRMTYKAELCKTCGTDPCVATPEYEIQYMAEYFAYGKVLREFIAGDRRERYLTTGNERDEETGLDNRNARWYDSDNSRFTGVDALASEAPDWSPFRYGFNNPVMFVDPGGMFEDWYQDENNNIRFFENESKESLDADGRRYSRICDACDVFVDNKLHYASGKGELFRYLDEVTVNNAANTGFQGFDQDKVDFTGSITGGVATLFGTAAHYSDYTKAARNIGIVGNVVSGVAYGNALFTGQAKPSHHLDASITVGLIGLSLNPFTAPVGITAGFIYGGARIIGGEAFDQWFNSQFESAPVLTPNK